MSSTSSVCATTSSNSGQSDSTPLAPDAVEEHQSSELYQKAEQYWATASADVNGVLGGFAHLHQPDITASSNFINGLKNKKLLHGRQRALDCGAGIGRVTRHLLFNFFDKVDMVDVTQELLNQADTYIGNNPQLGDKFCCGLQSFEPQEKWYNCIWIQWVTGHLTDDHFVTFMSHCQNALLPGGCIVLKENLASGEKAVFDSEDHSWTRPEKQILALFERANLKIVSQANQTGFPKGMYKVKMWALQPKRGE